MAHGYMNRRDATTRITVKPPHHLKSYHQW
jgi:hypothetical protein